VGGETVLPVDVRVVVATNKDLQALIQKGLFREDLYYRLNVISLEIPPLRHRREDIPLLAQHFLEMFVAKNRKEIKGFTPQAMDSLLRYDWPGNVRELMNAVERGVVLTRSEYLDNEIFHILPGSEESSSESFMPAAGFSADASLDQVEKAAILKTMEAVGGNKSEAARRLGITRKTLHKKLKHYGVM
jgi:two-component system, NtrC family, response regulator HydG